MTHRIWKSLGMQPSRQEPELSRRTWFWSEQRDPGRVCRLTHVPAPKSKALADPLLIPTIGLAASAADAVRFVESAETRKVATAARIMVGDMMSRQLCGRVRYYVMNDTESPRQVYRVGVLQISGGSCQAYNVLNGRRRRCWFATQLPVGLGP